MNQRELPFGVPNAEGVPRLTDVALFFCGRAISSAWSTVIAADTRAAEALATWYLQHVAFMHRRRTTSSKELLGENVTSFSGTVAKDFHHGEEANFSLAFNALCHGLCGKDTRSWPAQQEKKHERSSSMPTVFGFSEQAAFHRSSAPVSEEVQCVTGVDESRLGYQLFLELIDLCHDIAGVDVREDFICRLALLITGGVEPVMGTGKFSSGHQSADDRAVKILPALSGLFGVFNELSAIHAAGSITLAFTVWMGVSWNCASFDWQAHVARTVGLWLSDLEALLKKVRAPLSSVSFLPAKRHTRKSPESRSSTLFIEPLRNFYLSLDGKQQLNISSMCATMRRICEGRLLDDRSLLESLVQSGFRGMLQLQDLNVLESLTADQTAGSTVHNTQQSHYSILVSITSGVLLYSQFYLSVRSLDAALHCARMAVLVGHQWRSNELLTMAHYSSFLVHVSCQDTPAAAGDIAIMLQLADAAAHREGGVDPVDRNVPRFHAGCLGYIGAALLLLISPGTVDTSLRSVIINGTVAGAPALYDTVAGGNSSNNIGGSRSGWGVSHASAGTGTGGHSVVVQTIAQTVRHALWLSEMEAFLDPSSSFVTEMITGVARGTMMIIAGYYGVQLSLKPINTASLGLLLAQLDEEASTDPSPIACGPSPLLLLRETVRQTAHRVLAVQVGTLDAPPAVGPFNILHDFLMAVEAHYGIDGINVIEKDFFFVLTYRFVCAMWLRNYGYIKSAYQELTRLVESMLFHSRSKFERTFIDETSGMSVEDAASTLPSLNATTCREKGTLNAAEASEAPAAEVPSLADAMMSDAGASWSDAAEKKKNKGGLQYWPPDHLLLWQQVQFERAQLAYYLGYSSTLLEISETLRRVSAASHFVMGVLYADLISAMMWTQRGNYCGALHILNKLLCSAESIGLTLLQAHVRARQVSIFLTCNRWRDALDTLDAMWPLPSVLQRWHLISQLHARGELLMACSTATEEDLTALVEHYVQQMDACGCFVEELQQEDSVGITLTEKLSMHACIARFAVTSSTQRRKTWGENLNTVACELQRRQFQDGRWQLFCNMSMRNVCRDILSGTLLRQILQTS